MMDYDKIVLQAFLEKQLQLFPEKVAETEEEAADFLDDCMAVVVNSVKEVWEYFDEAGLDVEDYDESSILEAEEVFEIGDGRFLIIEA
ncbi:MAG: glyoxalase [Lachnospiraceae bacterium]|nr:glyoxalase [Lachnospiraceae bacterium]MBQ7834083.1 glyoxalase [Lachnospiraceae bacterium]